MRLVGVLLIFSPLMVCADDAVLVPKATSNGIQFGYTNPVAHSLAVFPGGYPVIEGGTITARIPPEDSTARTVMSVTCFVLIWVRSHGEIRAAQLVQSTGQSGLNEACIKGVTEGTRFAPGQDDEVARDRWAVMHFEFRLVSERPPVQPPPTYEPIAILAPNQAFDVDHVPEGARSSLGTSCAAHFAISASGSVEQVALRHSTSSSVFDKICNDTASTMKFMPARRDGLPVAGTADVLIRWPAANKDSSQ